MENIILYLKLATFDIGDLRHPFSGSKVFAEFNYMFTSHPIIPDLVRVNETIVGAQEIELEDIVVDDVEIDNSELF